MSRPVVTGGDWRDLKAHELAALPPPLLPDDYKALVESIREHGLQDPILLTPQGDQIIDGCHRHRACVELNAEPKFERFDTDDRQAIWALVLRRMVHRHMASSQKAAWAVTIERVEAEFAAAREIEGKRKGGEKRAAEATRGEGGKFEPGGGKKLPAAGQDAAAGGEKRKRQRAKDSNKAAARAAAVAGTNRQYVADMKAIEKQAADGHPVAVEVLPELRAGTMKIPQAKRKIKEHDRREQSRSAVKTAAAPAVIRAGNGIDALLDHPPVDLLLTDPPYATDVEDIHEFAGAWVSRIGRALKPTSRAYICTGAYPHELQAYLNALEEHVPTHRIANVMVWTYRNTMGPSPNHDYKMNWQAIFHLVGPKAPPLDCPELNERFSVQDINAPDGRHGEGRYHAWEKPAALAERLIRHSTKPGDTVLDPFAGTGTFVLTAARLGRKVTGYEIDDDMLSIAEKRGCSIER